MKFLAWSDLHKEVSITGAKLQLLEPVFVNAIKFLQNVRIDFESIHENVMSDLQKEVSIAEPKLHLLELLFVNMSSSFFTISLNVLGSPTKCFWEK